MRFDITWLIPRRLYLVNPSRQVIAMKECAGHRAIELLRPRAAERSRLRGDSAFTLAAQRIVE